VLIPRGPSLRELEDLAPHDLERLIGEILAAGRAVRAIGQAGGFGVAKLNVGALGNVVSQLHVHIVGRREGDPAWPGPVWGFGAPVDYAPAAVRAALALARDVLGVSS
jgi:diadenosine tetraphosphate (Ap4A) HIT family hydrolase